ncbi:MAG: hypothetical protein WD230_01375 [Cucumibacter sp.]
MRFVTVLTLRDAGKARVIVAALRAHGFHPLEGTQNGAPGLPGVIGLNGIEIKVPADEAEDAAILAGALSRDMGE